MYSTLVRTAASSCLASTVVCITLYDACPTARRTILMLNATCVHNHSQAMIVLLAMACQARAAPLSLTPDCGSYCMIHDFQISNFDRAHMYMP